MNIELTDTEAREIRDVLEERLGELRKEVHHADLSDFREGLKAREALLRAILAKLPA